MRAVLHRAPGCAFLMMVLMGVTAAPAGELTEASRQAGQARIASADAEQRLREARRREQTARQSLERAQAAHRNLQSRLDTRHRALASALHDRAGREEALHRVREDIHALHRTLDEHERHIAIVQNEATAARAALESHSRAASMGIETDATIQHLEREMDRARAVIEQSPMSLLHRHFTDRVLLIEEELDELSRRGDVPPERMRSVEVAWTSRVRMLRFVEIMMPFLDPALASAWDRFDHAGMALAAMEREHANVKNEPTEVSARLREAERRLAAAMADAEAVRNRLVGLERTERAWIDGLNAQAWEVERTQAAVTQLVHDLNASQVGLTAAQRGWDQARSTVAQASRRRDAALANARHWDARESQIRKILLEKREREARNRPGGGPPVRGPVVGPRPEKDEVRKDRDASRNAARVDPKTDHRKDRGDDKVDPRRGRPDPRANDGADARRDERRPQRKDDRVRENKPREDKPEVKREEKKQKEQPKKKQPKSEQPKKESKPPKKK